jgi:hypothetical protein
MLPDVRQRYADLCDEAPDDEEWVRLVADLDALYTTAPLPEKLAHATAMPQQIDTGTQQDIAARTQAPALLNKEPPVSRRPRLAHLPRKQGYPLVATLLLAAMLAVAATTIFPFRSQNNAGHPAPEPINTNVPAPSNTPIPTPTATYTPTPDFTPLPGPTNTPLP